jgi:hypothetical protein
MNKRLITLIIIAILATIMYLISGYKPKVIVPCSLEAKICPDGTTVVRSGPNCEFAPCPIVKPTINEKIPCSGPRGLKCPEGYTCNISQFPDASGICIKITNSISGYQCPPGNYVDCMPGPVEQINELKWECSAEYLQWAQENCPDFKGAAY